MKLHTETFGSGPDVVLVHGWGLHGGIWAQVAERLAHSCRVTLVDLPGHGRSPPLSAGSEGTDVDAVAGAVSEAVPAGAAWVGWSLGGMVALAAASRAGVGRLVLVGTNPRFVADAGWPGMAPELLAGFAEALAADYQTTLIRFLALQTRGAEGGRETLRGLRERVFAHGEPDPRALKAGLRILAEADLRTRLAGIALPALVVHGARDTLVPVEAAVRTAERLGAELAVIEGAGHAPFLSHSEAFSARLESFIHA
ncbi:pimeloyl-ACP methyl ester esterase BioH [Thiohalomonas denitrificans]|uniref:pimeloyl-ACP methyl ester esterase BioH n=1 Tax=Thiohalomonas denitrificans TaxID=415747 RepID=UPI000B884814|nr:pimeloyl-ACP methyl ester esterase BioH [Thiohalomonas denitrificans]